MAVPLLNTLEDCGSYAKTVEPYLDELYALPQAIADHLQASWSGEQGASLLDLYLKTNPLVSGFSASLFLGVVFFVVSEFNRNYSQVDRCWSLLPTFYIAHFDLWARLSGLPADRLDAVLLFSTVWSIRLTFNYARKGGYNVGSEDYRWEIVRKTVPAWLFHIFNLTFIAFIQSVLLFLLAAPTYTILLASQIEQELSPVDLIFAGTQLALITIEWFSDQQQWQYQSAKQTYLKTAKISTPKFTRADIDRGFVTSGLWAYSRHPNFAAEQAIWIALYQWSCYASKELYTWAGVGAGFLVMLFQGSTWLTELITSGKYSEYKEYQKQVGMFVPTNIRPYKAPPPPSPKVIRTSELAKRQMDTAIKASGLEKENAAAKRR